MSKKKEISVYIENYGCSANIAESEIMAGLLSKAGITLTKDVAASEVIIVNSCNVKTVTEQKILYRIKQLHNNHPEKQIIIAGCMPDAIPQKLKEEAPFVSLISTNQITQIEDVVKKTVGGDRVELFGGRSIKANLPKIRTNKLISIIEISDGCVGACTFCATKLAKKGIFSYPQDLIVEEVKKSVTEGCKEFWLTSQDLGAYGLDKGKRSLPELVKKICSVEGDFKLRLGMMNPDHIIKILPDLIEVYMNEKVYKFLHMPIQSGDDEMLKSMKRFYTTKEVHTIIKEFRKSFPNMQIWTDVIVGYPGETEEQFTNTLQLVKKIKFDQTNVSRFAKREGTPAAQLKQLPTDKVKKRTNKLSKIIRDSIKKENKRFVGWSGKVLISERGKSKNQWVGRNEFYRQVVVEGEDLFGKTINVEIGETSGFTLFGKVL